MTVTQVAENVHNSRAHAPTPLALPIREGLLTKFKVLADPN